MSFRPIAAFFLSFAAILSAAAQSASVLELPVRLRPGDAFLAWAAFSPPPARLEASIEGVAGVVATTVRVFDATELLDGTAKGAARLYGILAALPQGIAPGGYIVVLKGSEPAPIASGASMTSGSPATEGPPFELSGSFVVDGRSFASETIVLDAANTGIRTSVDTRKEDEARRLAELLWRSDTEALLIGNDPFVLPVVGSVQSADFGDRRIYAYNGGGSDTSIHAGIDLAVPKGTPVLACARGKVVFAAERIVTGNTLVLEHLPGLYSLYMHLSAIDVALGAVVERGEKIAAAGSTGLSTGPHLHWELRAAGTAVDPRPWLSSPPLDKGRLAAMIDALIEGR